MHIFFICPCECTQFLYTEYIVDRFINWRHFDMCKNKVIDVQIPFVHSDSLGQLKRLEKEYNSE